VTSYILLLFRGVPGALAFLRHLRTQSVKPGAGVATLREALALVSDGAAPLNSDAVGVAAA
jgi:tRNA-dihydrouridine synthase A